MWSMSNIPFVLKLLHIQMDTVKLLHALLLLFNKNVPKSGTGNKVKQKDYTELEK
jgi:hypothetical protein